MRRKRQRGVTLLELLVAMTLFSLLSVGVFASLRTGLTTLDKTRTRVAESRRKMGAQRVLERVLAEIMPLPAEFTPEGTQAANSVLFFQGEPQAMRFISSYSLEGGARSAPRLMELTVIGREDKQGVRLILNDLPYYGPRSAGFTIAGRAPDPLTNQPLLVFLPIVPNPGSFILADKLPACQFLYLDRAPPPEFDQWLPRWREGLLPRAVRILMGPERTMTASIHVSSISR